MREELKRNHNLPETKTGELEIKAPLSEAETAELETAELETAAVMDGTRDAIRGADERSRTEAVEVFTAPSERGLDFRVPQLEVLIEGELRLFDEPEAIDCPWSLPLYDATPTPEQLTRLGEAERVREGGEIDIDDERGRLTTRFSKDLQRDLELAYVPEHWAEAKLAAWCCRQTRAPLITHASKAAFVAAWLGNLLSTEGMDLALAIRDRLPRRHLAPKRVPLLRSYISPRGSAARAARRS